MNEEKKSRPVKELIEEYNRRLMEIYQRQMPSQPETDNRFLQDFPLPDVQRDREALAANTQPLEASVEQPDDTLDVPYTSDELQQRPPYPVEELQTDEAPEPMAAPYIGYLQVFAFTGQTAVPLEGARVVITRRQGEETTLYANTVTDRNGQTPVIPLPSVDPALTMQPNLSQPFISYDIQVNADGFSSALYRDVPVYGNNYVTQPAAMLPLLPGEDPNTPRIYYSGGPADL